jgi:tetrahydromethanopterin S-methyltransferase subunit G
MATGQIQLTDQQIEEIAERAAEVALNKVYTQVGKSVLKKLAWLTGAAVIGLVMWLSGHGSMPKG